MSVTANPYKEAKPRQVQQWLSQGEAVLVDVREADEHARERIRGAILAPLSKFDPGKVQELAKPGQKLVVHCHSGRRSADAALMSTAFCKPGVEVVSMVGGIEAWKSENLPVEVNATVSRISVMRQVQIVIGVGVLGGSALAWFVHPGFVAIPAFFGAGLLFAGASGTCALASILGGMPWNKGAAGSDSCAT
ncbi:MAG: rhodanese family protein [Planctomycetes bacterium]|nr:rhodanese family protein [Planctomycetota bacterium]